MIFFGHFEIVVDTDGRIGSKHPSAGGQLLRSVVEGERDGDAGKLINKDGISPF